ncbi:MAG: 4Fe-4S binding protein [Bacteroidales bacterium]|nr:4Fe-4S binding protein [Bacteroidales bacterium]
MLRKIRITLAAVFFIGITLLFLDVSGVLHAYLGWMAKIQFLPAVLAFNTGIIIALIACTLLFGRIYCSVICPLGILQDILARLRPQKNKKIGRYSYSREVRWLRYPVLALFVIAIIAGIGPFVALLAPYSSFGRIAVNLFRPLYEWCNNGLAAIAEHYDSYAFYSTEVWLRSLPTFLIAAATLIVLLVCTWIGGRTYCNTICPVGTFLSFLSRFSLLKIHFDEEKCRNCSSCTKNCKASCIDFKTHTVDYSRCVVCGDCIEHCKFDALHYTLPRKATTSELHKSTADSSCATPSTQNTARSNHNVSEPQTSESAQKTNTSRRAFLQTSLLFAASAALAQEKKKLKVDGGLADIEDKIAPERSTPVTPPGSLSAKNMASHCTGCQLCVAECPNGVLRPSAGLLTLMQPVMSFERGYCRPECNRCAEVCPTGAIRPITIEEKSNIQVGHAVWIKKNCIPVRDGVDCNNCERHCPTGAIQMVPLDPNDELGAYVPAINEAKCIGCGACENLCPARPFSAIYVEGHEVHKMV